MPDGNPYPYWPGEDGWIKISSDKKFLVSSYGLGAMVCSYNSSNGTSEYLCKLTRPIGDPFVSINGMEFSPDSKYLYVSHFQNGFTGNTDSSGVFQYDMQLVSDSALFYNSGILVGSGNTAGMQLARDGKIYLGAIHVPIINHYVSVIHNPWIRGTGCMYENDVLNLFPGEVHWSLPNILVDYLLRFEWEGELCQNYPIHFKPNFIPTPQTIQWDFDDGPGSGSWQLSPTYTFKNPGVHEVKVDVWYPSGRYEHTSREIEISSSPQPDLGPDTLICKDASLTLSAGCVADFFTWSTGQFGVSSITVSDSGTYWIRGRFNDSGCMGYDTIHVGFHPPTIIAETNLVITPTTCNGASGSITGLYALGPTPFWPPTVSAVPTRKALSLS
jgi:hypothetical protein